MILVKLPFRVAAICLAAVLVLGMLPSGAVYADDDLSAAEIVEPVNEAAQQDISAEEQGGESGSDPEQNTEQNVETPSSGDTEQTLETPFSGDTEQKAETPSSGNTEPSAETPSSGDTEQQVETPSADDTEQNVDAPSAGDTEQDTPDSQQEGSTLDESTNGASIDTDALTAWVREYPEQLSSLYKGDTATIAALAEYLGISEELASTCVSGLKDQNDLLVKAIEDGTDVLSIISFDTAEEAAEKLGVDPIAISLFGIKLDYVSKLLSSAMEEAEENGQEDTWSQELGEALGDEDKLSQLAGKYDVEPAVLGALLQSMGIEAIASTDTSLTLTNVELETPDGVDDTFVYQIFLWTTSSSGTVSALTGPYGDTEFEATRLYYTTAIGYQLPYDSYYTTYGYTEIPLNAGQSVTIPGLPEGCNYMILVSASANYYVKNATCTYGTVDDRIGAVYVYSASGPNEVVCYNDYAPNSLRITEAVISSDPDSVYDTFTFTIYLYSHSSTGDTPLFEGDSVNVEISIDGTGPAGLPTDLGSTLAFKTQSPDPDDPSVKLPGLDVTGTYNVATVTLKHGQSIVLKNLGKGYGCYVYQTPETHYMLYELASRHVYEKGVIADDFVGSYNEYYDYINSCNVSASLGFTNAQETLSITKQVVGSDTTRNYVFNVYFLQYLPDTDSYSPLRAGTFPLTYTNPTGNEPTTVEIGQRSDLSKQTTLTSSAIGSYTVEWSSAQIQVAAGQTVTIEKLPAAIAYFIEEVPVTNYTLTSATTTAASGVVNSRYNVYNWLSLTDEAATFTNTYVPPVGNDLTISKTVTGNMGDTNQAFSFDIALTDQSGSPLSSQDIQVLLPGKSAATMYTTDASGHLTLSLKHGQAVTLQDLPQGTKYTITESGADYYTTTFSVTGGTLGSSGSHTQSGALTGSADVTVQVNNDLTVAVPTGIRTEVQPFLVLLAFSLVTLLLMILGKKRNARR
jgi:hypothetical protein